MNSSLDERMAATTPAGDLAERLFETLTAFHRRLRNEMRLHGATADSVPQFRALRFIERYPGTDLGGLADHLGVGASSASALVERLVRAGFVERTVDASERRRMCLGLTAAGAATVESALLATKQWLQGELAALDPADRGRIDEALEPIGRIGDGRPA
jgi:DNA-binding MarR family transcriptional regulator